MKGVMAEHADSSTRRIFTARLPGSVAPSARKTTRLVTTLRTMASPSVGAAGLRLAARLRPLSHVYETYGFTVEEIRGWQGLRPLRQPDRRG
jgi:hypothetical protein